MAFLNNNPIMKRNVNRTLLYMTLIIFCLFFLIPVYVLLATSLKSFANVSISEMWLFPKTFHIESFSEAFEKLLPNLINSFILVISATICTIIIGSDCDPCDLRDTHSHPDVQKLLCRSS